MEDIFKVVEYLDAISAPRPHQEGRGCQFERDIAFWELRLKISQLHVQIAETYLLTVDGVTEDEKRAFREWVEAGNSIYDNPYSLYNESGCPMDFINGCRNGSELAAKPYEFLGCEYGGPDDGWDGEDDGILF